MSVEKKSLREKLLKDRLAISPEDFRSKSQRICERIARLESLAPYTHIALYVSFRNEVDVSALRKLMPDKEFYYPKTDTKAGTMEFLRANTDESFVKNRWGLMEPDDGVRLAPENNPLIIVPALAFDRKGHRLGYGKGFYDRFLAARSYRTLGVCFSEFLFDALPAEAHDRPVNQVVTEIGSLDVTVYGP